MYKLKLYVTLPNMFIQDEDQLKFYSSPPEGPLFVALASFAFCILILLWRLSLSPDGVLCHFPLSGYATSGTSCSSI